MGGSGDGAQGGGGECEKRALEPVKGDAPLSAIRVAWTYEDGRGRSRVRNRRNDDGSEKAE